MRHEHEHLSPHQGSQPAVFTLLHVVRARVPSGQAPGDRKSTVVRVRRASGLNGQSEAWLCRQHHGAVVPADSNPSDVRGTWTGQHLKQDPGHGAVHVHTGISDRDALLAPCHSNQGVGGRNAAWEPQHAGVTQVPNVGPAKHIHLNVRKRGGSGEGTMGGETRTSSHPSQCTACAPWPACHTL